MKLKDFLQNKTLSALDLIDFDYNQIINIYVDDICYGLDIDTTNIPFSTPLIHTTDFTLNGDILSVSDFSINTNDVIMLGM